MYRCHGPSRPLPRHRQNIRHQKQPMPMTNQNEDLSLNHTQYHCPSTTLSLPLNLPDQAPSPAVPRTSTNAPPSRLSSPEPQNTALPPRPSKRLSYYLTVTGPIMAQRSNPYFWTILIPQILAYANPVIQRALLAVAADGYGAGDCEEGRWATKSGRRRMRWWMVGGAGGVRRMGWR